MANIIIGLLCVAFGLWGMSVWWYSMAELLRGTVPLILLVFGVVALMAGVTGVRNEAEVLSDSDIEEQLKDKPDGVGKE